MKIIKSKLFKILSILLLTGFIIGIVYFFIVKSSNKEVIENNLIKYINSLKDNNSNSLISLFNSIKYNIKYLSIIWVVGIIFILIFLIPIIIVFKGILIGYSFINIIGVFHLKGILIAFFLLFPCVIINNFILILMSYYSINQANKTFNTIKENKSINLKNYFKNYTLIYLILSICLIISSLIEIYLSSNIIKFIV